jgi:outer membrane protein assembly factor BamB
VLDTLIITAGATGKLRAVDRATGTLVWAHDLYTEFGGHVQDEYYAASPLRYRDTIIVPVGGAGQSVMAFNIADGRVAWKALDFRISYASPILIDVDGEEQAVLMMESEVIGIDPRDGRLLWQYPHANNTKTNVSTPIWGPGNLLFVSSAYSSAGRVLKLTRQGGTTTVTELWNSRDLRVHVANAIRIGDTVYGSSGDFGPTFFRAVDVASGRVLWERRDVGKASIIKAGDSLILLNEDGELLLAEPGASGLRVIARAPVLTKTAWTPPSLAGGILYVRDRGEIAALDLRGPQSTRGR